MQWLEGLYREHNVMLLRVARNRLGYDADRLTEAEDVVQDVFVLAAGKNIRSVANPVGWLIVATENICRNRYRRHLSNVDKKNMLANRILANQPARYAGLSVSAQDDEAEAVSLDVSIQQELTEEEYRLFNQYYREGRSVESISRQLGTTPGAVRARLHRLKKKTRKISLLVAVIFSFSQNI